ncbi:uncharacterized protein LOC120686860 [Panicum virgatum]|uniref:Uncharacterized protein n=1 Tax=Panicum virgatum TaxID=38727 RepID=A0A8T0P9N3_PANVG|nr:uncharacterized protein LOC120686860 [Panicum virgatum]KAG2555956.1 hypothetical protein PVAP13_8NG044100 [Panicum virgatum]
MTYGKGNKGSNPDGGNIPPGEKMKQLFDKSLGTVASLSKLLPTGTTLAFQTMAPAFTKGGECEDHDVNFAFTWGLISFLTVLCAALSFTDSITDKNGVTYYGVATPTGFKLFNRKLRGLELAAGGNNIRQLRRMRMNWMDFLHAGVSAAVFVAIAFCDAGVQRCLVKQGSQAWKDFLNHLPLAVGFLASFVLIIYPSKRKGIGDDGVPEADDDTSHQKRWRFDKSMVTVAGLSKLLPAGTTLAFQTMAPSFTRGGECQRHGVNFAFTWGLIVFLTVLCAALSFTDSITDRDGVTYYGIATPLGFRLFDHHPTMEGEDEWEELKRRRRIKRRDCLHALLSAAVFVAIAFCDAGVQACLIPKESRQWREFLALLPLAVGFVASFVFIVFPSTRKGIGHEGASTPDQIEVKKDEGTTATTTTTSTTTTTTTTTKTWKKNSVNTQVAPSSSAV